jgi:hypothetical protein
MTATQDLTAARPPQQQRLDVHAACTFVTTQSRWLAHALAHADSADVVGTALGLHDASHGSWLRLISDAGAFACEAAAVLGTLYGTQGRVVGSLERGADVRLPDDVRQHVRDLLVRHLEEATAAAVGALRTVEALQTAEA